VIEVALVDLVPGYKAVDVDGMIAFDLNGFQFFLFDLDILTLFQFLAAPLLVAFHHVAGLGIDHLLFQPVSGFLVDHVESGFFNRRRSRVKQHRTGHERKLQGAFPIGANGHYNLRLAMR
jgi:hypothetical protein